MFWAVLQIFSDFYVHLETNSFSERISEMYGKRFGVVLKLEFEVKNW